MGPEALTGVQLGHPKELWSMLQWFEADTARGRGMQ